MPIFAVLLLLVIGLAILIKGADLLVDGSSSLAVRFKIPEIVIGLTIVAFGTSMPEIVVNIFSSIAGSSEIVLGNIIGSNIANLFLILGLSTVILPIVVKKTSVRRELPYSILAAAVLFLLANDAISGGTENIITRFDGIIMLVFFVFFLIYIYFHSKSHPEEESHFEAQPVLKTVLFLILGLAGLIVGGKLVVDNAILIARSFNVSEKFISLTIVSIGTSLPELVTSLVAAFKKHNDIAVGNVIGSNIFNIFLVLGISATINPIKYLPVLNSDLILLTAVSALLFASLIVRKKKIVITRIHGLLLVLSYAAYTVYLFIRK